MTASTSTYRCFLLGLTMLAATALIAQTDPYLGNAVLPGNAGSVTVRFDLSFAESEGQTVRLDDRGKVAINSSNVQISGVDQATINKIRIEFSASSPPVNIKSRLVRNGERYFSPVTLSSGGQMTIPMRISMLYDGAPVELTPAVLRVSRNFLHPGDQMASEVPPTDPATNNNLTAGNNTESTNNRPAEVPDNNTTTSPEPPQPRHTPPPAPKSTEAELAYKRIGQEEYTYKSYFDEWQLREDHDRRLLNRALARTPVTQEVLQTEDGFILSYSYGMALELDTILPDPELGKLELTKLEGHRYQLHLPLSAIEDYKILLQDNGKIKPLQSIEFGLDNLLYIERIDSAQTAQIVLKVQGGQPPYQLFLMRDGRKYGSVVTNKSYSPEQAHYASDNHTWTIALDYLGALVNETGDYQFQLYDATGTATSTLREAVHLTKPSLELPVWLPYLGGAIALLLLWSILRSRAKSRNRKRVREELKKMDENRKTGTAVTNNTQTKKPALESPAHKRKEAPAVAFSVRKRARERSLDTFAFRPDTEASDFLTLALESTWRRSLVEQILFSRKAISELDSFLRAENTSKINRIDGEKWERNEAIPEIGGMLMGQYKQLRTGDYLVSIEEFIPLEARKQNVIKVEIDPLSLARDLGRMQDEHPELTVVGWFHTHPGHGLFLSEPDLKVQLVHFRKPFQFAMEIDSLSEHLDTAFFSYRSEGVINNREQKIDGSRWFSWSDIEKFTRRVSVS